MEKHKNHESFLSRYGWQCQWISSTEIQMGINPLYYNTDLMRLLALNRRYFLKKRNWSYKSDQIEQILSCLYITLILILRGDLDSLLASGDVGRREGHSYMSIIQHKLPWRQNKWEYISPFFSIFEQNNMIHSHRINPVIYIEKRFVISGHWLGDSLQILISFSFISTWKKMSSVFF